MSKYPTAKQKMEEGKWIHLDFIKYRWFVGAHYYAETIKDKGFNLIRIEAASLMGAPFFKLLIILLTLMKCVLNVLPIIGRVGDELFDDGIDELKEMSRARRHLESTGISVQIGYKANDLEECERLIEKDIVTINENIERRRKKK